MIKADVKSELLDWSSSQVCDNTKQKKSPS